MAYLIPRARKNPATGKIETYYLIGDGHWAPDRAIGFVSKTEAKRQLHALHGKIARGEVPRLIERPSAEISAPSPSSSPTGVPTLGEWWGTITDPWPEWPDCPMVRYLRAEGKVDQALRMWDDSRRTLLPLVIDGRPLAVYRLDEVDVELGDAIVAALRNRKPRPLSGRSIQIKLGHLQGGLDVAVEYRRIESAPRLRRPPAERARPEVWHTPTQLEALVDELVRRHARGKIDRLSLLAIVVGSETGLRRGELLTRRWTDVDWDGSGLRIADQVLPEWERKRKPRNPASKGKIGDKVPGRLWKPKNADSYRSYPLSPELLLMLREEWIRAGQPDGWIFPGRDDPAKPRGNFTTALTSACRAAGLPRLHPHALRHSAATAWAWAGALPADLRALGGWGKTSPIPDRIYVHTTKERTRAIAATASLAGRRRK